MIRHGDVCLQKLTKEQIKQLGKPKAWKAETKRGESVLFHGEATGHAHRVGGADVHEIEVGGKRVLVTHSVNPYAVTHEEHGTIPLKEGEVYAAAQKRQYSDSSRGWDEVRD